MDFSSASPDGERPTPAVTKPRVCKKDLRVADAEYGLFLGSGRKLPGVEFILRACVIASNGQLEKTPRSVWSARSLLPLLGRHNRSKAPASRTHSNRFAKSADQD